MNENPPVIDKELERIEEDRQRVLAMSDVARMAHAVADVFPQLKVEVSIVRRPCRAPFVCLQPEDVASFKDVLPMLTDLASRGWHTNKHEPFTDYHAIRRREWNLLGPGETAVKGGPEPAYKIKILAFLKSEGATCKAVKVGEKTEDVFEYVCE